MAVTNVESRVLGANEASLAIKRISGDAVGFDVQGGSALIGIDGILKLEMGTNLVDLDMDGAPEVLNVNNSPDGYFRIEAKKIADCKCTYSGLFIFGMNRLVCSTGDHVSYSKTGNVKLANNETTAAEYYLFLDKDAIGERTYKIITLTSADRTIESTIETRHSVVRNDISSNIGKCGLPSEDEIVNILEDTGYSVNKEKL